MNLENLHKLTDKSEENFYTLNNILNGKRDHSGEEFNCHVGCVAWPFGKIKIATPLIKD